VGNSYFNTAAAARRLGMTPSALGRALWEGRADAPPRAPSGAYLWQRVDVERVAAQLGIAFAPETMEGHGDA